MNRLEDRLKRIYHPEPRPWKRKLLFRLSGSMITLVSVAGYCQFETDFTRPLIWWLLSFIGILGLAGLLVAIYGSDFWVALILGRF